MGGRVRVSPRHGRPARRDSGCGPRTRAFGGGRVPRPRRELYADSEAGAVEAGSAFAKRRTMSPAGSIEWIVATLLPACQYSFAASDVSSDARLSCHSDRSAYIERM